MKKINSLVLVVILFISLVYLFSLDTRLGDFGGDNAQYIILAQALASGKGYRAINYPGEPAFTLTPPVFPLLLTPLVYFFGNNFFLMHILIAILAIFSVILIFQIIKVRVSQEIVILVLFLTGINAFFLTLAVRSILTEIPYLFFTLVALFSFERYIDDRSRTKFLLFLSIAAAMLASLTRSIGVIIPFSFLTFCIFNYRLEQKTKKILILCGLLSLLPSLLWFIKTLQVSFTGRPPYGFIKQFLMSELLNDDARSIGILDLVARIGLNLKICFVGMREYVFPTFMIRRIPESLLAIFFQPLFIISLFFGLFQKIKKNISILEVYFVLYVFLLLFWHIHEIHRYLVPVLFLIFFYFFSGIEFIRNLNLPAQIKKMMAGVFYLAVASSIFLNSCQVLNTARTWESESRDYRLMNFLLANKWIRDNAESQAIILSRKPTLTYLFAQRQALGYPFTKQDKVIINYMRANAVKYVIVDECFRESVRFLAAAIKQNLGLFKLRYSVSHTLVLEFIPN